MDSEATIRLNFQIPGDPSGTLRQMSDQTRQLSQGEAEFARLAAQSSVELEKKANRIVQARREQEQLTEYMRRRGFDDRGRPIEGQPSAASRAADVMSGGPSLTALVPQIAAVTAALAAMERAALKIAAVGNIMQRGDLTVLQKQAGIESELVPFSQTARTFHGSMTGHTEYMRASAAAFQRAQFAQQLGHQAALATTGLEFERQGYSGRQAANYSPTGVFDRGTFAGELLTAEEARLKPARDAQSRANRDLAESQRMHGLAGSGRAAAQAAYDAAQQHALDAAARLEAAQSGSGVNPREALRAQLLGRLPLVGGFRRMFFDQSGQTGSRETEQANINAAAKVAQEAQQDALNKSKELQAAINREKETGLRLTEAESAARRGNITHMQAELQNLRAREQVYASSATRLGGMDTGSRMQGLAAVRFISQFGMGAATPEIVAAAQGIAPHWAQERMQAFGQRTPEYRELQRMGITEFGDLQAARAAANQQQFAVDAKIQIDENALAKKLAERIDPLLKDLIGVITAEVRQRLDKKRSEDTDERNTWY